MLHADAVLHDIGEGRLSATQIEQNFHALQPPLNDMQAVLESARCLFCFEDPNIIWQISIEGTLQCFGF